MQPAGSPEFKSSIIVKNKRITSDFPLIVHESRPKAWSEWSKASGIEIPDDARITRLDSMIAVVRAAQRGIGAALIPVPVGELWFSEGSVVPLFKQQLVADVGYYLVTKEERVADKSVSLLRDWIVARFQNRS
jgi:LysR family glycine cleavage system transcriptional activator